MIDAAIEPPEGLVALAPPDFNVTTQKYVTRVETARVGLFCTCGGRARMHGRRQILISDVPRSGSPVALLVSYHRMWCHKCLTSYRQTIPGVEENFRTTSRLVEYLRREADSSVSVSELAVRVGLDRKTVRKILVDQAEKSLLKHLQSTPQVLGVAKCEIGGRTATVMWDVCDRRVIHYIMSGRAADIRRWLQGMPDKGAIVVAVVDTVDSLFNVVAETLPDSMIAVNPFLIRERMLEIGSELLSKSQFKAFKKTDPYLLSFRSFAEPVQRSLNIVEVNPYLEHAYAARKAFHRVWKARDPVKVARALDQFLEGLPKVLRRSNTDIVRAVEQWHEQLSGSVTIPGLSRYTTGRSMLGSTSSKAIVDGCGIFRHQPFDDESYALCHFCLNESQRWTNKTRRMVWKSLGGSSRTFSVIRTSCVECNGLVGE